MNTIKITKLYKGDYFYILPCLAIDVEEDEWYMKIGWFKWFFGIYKCN